MAIDLVQIRTLAKQKEEENWNFRSFVKHDCELTSEEIDEQVFAATRRVWAGIDCTTCANCCREVKPTFSEEDVERLARRLGMDRVRFIEAYLEPNPEPGESPWQTRTTPCPFLKDNLCSVYDDRPADCSGYPYLYEPEFWTRTIGMLERIPTCPIVYEVIEDLKKSLGFWRSQERRGRRRRRM
jgi:hypothetical protein